MSPLHHCSSVLTGLSGSVLVLLKLSGEETDLDISTCCSPTPCPWQAVFYQVDAKASPAPCSSVMWQCLSSFRWRWFPPPESGLDCEPLTVFKWCSMSQGSVTKGHAVSAWFSRKAPAWHSAVCYERPRHVDRAVLGDPVNRINSLPWVIPVQIPDMWIEKPSDNYSL